MIEVISLMGLSVGTYVFIMMVAYLLLFKAKDLFDVLSMLMIIILLFKSLNTNVRLEALELKEKQNEETIQETTNP